MRLSASAVSPLTYGRWHDDSCDRRHGNIGRRIVDELIHSRRQRHREIPGTHKKPAKANLPAGVEVVTGYLGI